MFDVLRQSCRVLKPLIIRNDWPIVGWVFGGAWIGALLVFTYLYGRDGGFGQFDPLIEAGVLLAFWMGGLVLMSQTLALPRTCLTILGGRAELTRAWLWRSRREQLNPAVLRDIAVRQERDSDGGPYYRLVLGIGPGEPLVLSESADRGRVEARRDEILARV